MTDDTSRADDPPGPDDACSRTLKDVIDADFAQYGRKAVEALRKERPHEYLKLVASLSPKELLPRTLPTVEDMTDDEFTRVLNAVRSFAFARGSGPDGSGGA